MRREHGFPGRWTRASKLVLRDSGYLRSLQRFQSFLVPDDGLHDSAAVSGCGCGGADMAAANRPLYDLNCRATIAGLKAGRI